MRIGIVGYGRIGHELAQRCKALGLTVKAYDPYVSERTISDSDIEFVENIINIVDEIDVLALTLPLNNETEGMIDEKIISSASKKMVIINTSRALVVNQKDLIKSLKANKIKSEYLSLYKLSKKKDITGVIKYSRFANMLFKIKYSFYAY